MASNGAMHVAATGPSIATVRVDSLVGPSYKLDAKHYQNEFVAAQMRVAKCGWPLSAIIEKADAFVPGRAKLVFVPNRTAGAPYLKAHDAFSVLPYTSRYLSKVKTEDYDSYILPENCLLTPSSGRNLGPLTYVGSSLSHFAMSDVMRIVPKSKADIYYLMAFLLTPTGQALLRRDRTGTNVDHLSPDDVLAMTIPWPDEPKRDLYGRAIEKAERLIDSARSALWSLADELCSELKIPRPAEISPSNGAEVFSTSSGSLSGRLDAAFHSDARRNAARLLGANSRRLDDASDLKMLGRYKRYYVPAPNGRPILSGRQLLQLRPVNLQRISDRSFSNPDDFIIQEGWTLFTCDGRSEEALASPAYVSKRWDGWLASNHVMRAIPKNGVHPGFLYLAVSNYCAQTQLKRSATGSVIDAIDPDTIRGVLIPKLDKKREDDLGQRCVEAWESIAEGLKISETTVDKLEQDVADAYEKNASQAKANAIT